MIRKRFNNALNICSGKKINLIHLSKKLNKFSFNKNIIFKNSNKKLKKDIYGNNILLKKLGIKKFKNLNFILKTFLNGKKKNINFR